MKTKKNTKRLAWAEWYIDAPPPVIREMVADGDFFIQVSATDDDGQGASTITSGEDDTRTTITKVSDTILRGCYRVSVAGEISLDDPILSPGWNEREGYNCFSEDGTITDEANAFGAE